MTLDTGHTSDIRVSLWALQEGPGHFATLCPRYEHCPSSDGRICFVRHGPERCETKRLPRPPAESYHG